MRPKQKIAMLDNKIIIALQDGKVKKIKGSATLFITIFTVLKLGQ